VLRLLKSPKLWLLLLLLLLIILLIHAWLPSQLVDLLLVPPILYPKIYLASQRSFRRVHFLGTSSLSLPLLLPSLFLTALCHSLLERCLLRFVFQKVLNSVWLSRKSEKNARNCLEIFKSFLAILFLFLILP
jgi:hypothetical protein